MSALQDKYALLIQQAQQVGIQDLKIREQENVLYIDGILPGESVKDQLWNTYNQIDPDYRSGDLVMNLTLADNQPQEYEVQKGDSLSKIGERFGVAWKDIYELNRDKISNPDLIQPGWKLKVPNK